MGYEKDDCNCKKEKKNCYDYSYKKYYVKKCYCKCCFEPYNLKDDGYKSDYDYDYKKDYDHKFDYDYDYNKDYDYDHKKDDDHKSGYNCGCKKRY